LVTPMHVMQFTVTTTLISTWSSRIQLQHVIECPLNYRTATLQTSC
jgi:hypothetical protein